MLKEISLQLKPLPGARVSLSPAVTQCWSDEDYIGRISRASRACHGSVVSIGAMRKAMGMYKVQFDRVNASSEKSTKSLEFTKTTAKPKSLLFFS